MKTPISRSKTLSAHPLAYSFSSCKTLLLTVSFRYIYLERLEQFLEGQREIMVRHNVNKNFFFFFAFIFFPLLFFAIFFLFFLFIFFSLLFVAIFFLFFLYLVVGSPILFSIFFCRNSYVLPEVTFSFVMKLPLIHGLIWCLKMKGKIFMFYLNNILIIWKKKPYSIVSSNFGDFMSISKQSSGNYQRFLDFRHFQFVARILSIFQLTAI